MSERDWTPTDAADAADAERDRQWWKRPDPFDPANQPDPADTDPWSDLEDDLADVISDSMDMDWTSRIGARAVVEFLKALGARIP